MLILDEPANGLDPEGVHWLRTFLRSQADAGRTVVVSSHLLAEVAQTVDHVVILDKGRLITSAPLAELTARSRSAVIVRTPDADRLRAELTRRGIDATVTGPDQVTATDTTPEAVGRVIGTIGLVIYEMRLEESNLEDVFFSLTNTEGAIVMNRLVRTELLKQRTTRTFVAGICAAPAGGRPHHDRHPQPRRQTGQRPARTRQPGPRPRRPGRRHHPHRRPARRARDGR